MSYAFDISNAVRPHDASHGWSAAAGPLAIPCGAAERQQVR